MSLPSPSNPFAPSHDPREYVARPASEEALRRLAALVKARVPGILLHGPAGIGKSMLLRVLRERLADQQRVVYASVSASPEAELSHRILGLLGERAGGDPTAALIAAARVAGQQETPLLVLIDHANCAPLASSLQLLRAAEGARPHLSVVFAVSDEVGADEFGSALAEEGELAHVPYDEVMNEGEAADYLRARLARPDTPSELRERLDGHILRWLAASSSGLPGKINQRATELLQQLDRGEEPRLEAPPATPPARDRVASRRERTGSNPVASLGGGLLGSPIRPTPDFSGEWKAKYGPGYLAPGGPQAPPAAPVGPQEGAAAVREAPESAADEAGGRDPRQSAPAAGRSGATEALAAQVPAAHASGAAPTPEPGSPPQAAPAMASRGGAARRGEGTKRLPGSRPRRTLLRLAALVAAALAGGFLVGRLGLPEPPARVAPPGEVSGRAAPAPPAASSAGRSAPTGRVAVAAGVPSLESQAADAPPGAPSESGGGPADATTAVEAGAAPPIAAPSLAFSALAAAAPAPAVPEAGVTAQSLAPLADAEPTPPGGPELPSFGPDPDGEIAGAEPSVPAQPAEGARGAPSSAPLEPAAPGRAPLAYAAPTDRTRAVVPEPDPVAASRRAAAAIVVGSRGEAPYASEPTAYVRLQVRMEPGWTLRIDGETIGTAPFDDLILPPGMHSFVAVMPDGDTVEQLVDVSHRTGVVEF